MGTKESDLVWRNNETSELWIKRPKDGVVIAGMLSKLFNRQVDKLNGALMTIPCQHVHKRTKHFIFGEVALGFALNNTLRIGNHESHFMKFTSNHNLLVDGTTCCLKSSYNWQLIQPY